MRLEPLTLQPQSDALPTGPPRQVRYFVSYLSTVLASVPAIALAVALFFSQDSVSSCRAITTLLIIIVLLFSALYLQTLSWWLHLKTLRVWSGESHSVECLWQISLSCLIFMKPCRALGHLAILWTYASPVLVRPLSVTVHDCICGYAILELILHHPYTFLSSYTIIPFL